MRVLLLNDLIPPENRGEAGAAVWQLAQGLRDAGHDIHLIAATEQPSFSEERDGIPTYHIHSQYHERWRAWRSLHNPQTLPELRKLYAQIQPEVINAHNIHRDLSYDSLKLAHQMGIPAVFTSHDVMPFAYTKLSHFINKDNCDNQPEDYKLPSFYNLRRMGFRYNPWRNWVIRRILMQHTQVRTAPSQALCDAQRVNGLPPFTCVYNGVDVGQFQASDESIQALRQRYGLEGRKVLLFAGRLTGAKGTRPLLDALRIVVREIPETALLVLSSTPIAEQLANNAYAELAQNHLVSGGWLAEDELAAAYHLSDVVVMPSIIFESFGMVLVEAMAARKPAIGGCFGGTNEVVLDGETGFLVNPHQTSDLAERILLLLRDADLRQKMGEVGYQRAVSVFSLENQVQQMVNIYQQARVLHSSAT
ncbi:MAG: glycosyltransferase family 4 protein [Anaerolineae bacterium]|nr:glycosyltransferase family 4 protein [Anaerolineae bacterium]